MNPESFRGIEPFNSARLYYNLFFSCLVAHFSFSFCLLFNNIDIFGFGGPAAPGSREFDNLIWY